MEKLATKYDLLAFSLELLAGQAGMTIGYLACDRGR
jgi:hypothetical protein